MGVELVSPEPVALFNEFSYIMLGAILTAFIIMLTYTIYKENINFRFRWTTAVGSVLGVLAVTGFALGSVAAMNITFDQEAQDALNATREAVEDHYGVEFISGAQPFRYDAREGKPEGFGVSFAAEDEVVYSGQVEIAEGRATLVVPDDLNASRYVEYGTGFTASAENSIVSTEVNTAKKYADWIALGVFAVIIAGLITGWKLNDFYEDESLLGRDGRMLRWLGFSALSAAALAIIFIGFPYLIVDDSNRDSAAEADFRALEESYEVEDIAVQDTFFSPYSQLNSDNTLVSVTFRDLESEVVEGFIRAKDGEVSLLVEEGSAEVEFVEYSESLLNR